MGAGARGGRAGASRHYLVDGHLREGREGRACASGGKTAREGRAGCHRAGARAWASVREIHFPACPLALYAKRARVVGARGAKRGVA